VAIQYLIYMLNSCSDILHYVKQILVCKCKIFLIMLMIHCFFYFISFIIQSAITLNWCSFYFMSKSLLSKKKKRMYRAEFLVWLLILYQCKCILFNHLLWYPVPIVRYCDLYNQSLSSPYFVNVNLGLVDMYSIQQYVTKFVNDLLGWG
jgi:hypothetical protein